MCVWLKEDGLSSSGSGGGGEAAGAECYSQQVAVDLYCTTKVLQSKWIAGLVGTI